MLEINLGRKLLSCLACEPPVQVHVNHVQVIISGIFPAETLSNAVKLLPPNFSLSLPGTVKPAAAP